MKRILSPALLLLCLLFLLPNERSVARQAAQREQRQCPFQTISEGVRVLKIWEITDLQWPRIVILRLSIAEYEKFLRDPKGYINVPEIYGKYPTRHVFGFHLERVPRDPRRPVTECVVTISHGQATTSVATSSCPTG